MGILQNTVTAHESSVKTEVRCRHCHSTDCFRIKRGSFVKTLLGLFPLKHYRCPRCMRTFYIWK